MRESALPKTDRPSVAIISAGAQGLVSAGFAPGLTTPAAKQALERLSEKGIPVVLCSRAASGRVVNPRYAARKQMIAGEDLSPQKAENPLDALHGERL